MTVAFLVLLLFGAVFPLTNAEDHHHGYQLAGLEKRTAFVTSTLMVTKAIFSRNRARFGVRKRKTLQIPMEYAVLPLAPST